MKRKERVSLAAEKAQIGVLSEELQRSQTDLNKKIIRLTLDQRALEKEQIKNQSLEKELALLK